MIPSQDTITALVQRLSKAACLVVCTMPLACRKVDSTTVPEPELMSVSSSAMEAVGYDDDRRLLAIEFENGAVYHYFDVPSAVHEGLMGAESHGRYFHQYIRGADYKCERVR